MNEINLKTRLDILDNLRNELDDLNRIYNSLICKNYGNLFYRFRLNKLVGIFFKKYSCNEELVIPVTIIPLINKVIENRIIQVKSELESYFNNNDRNSSQI